MPIHAAGNPSAASMLLKEDRMKNARIASLMFGTMLLAACTASPAPNDTASRALNEMRAVARPIPPKAAPEMRKSPRSNSTMPNATRNLHEFVPHSAMTWTRPRPEPTNLNFNSVSVIKICRRSGVPPETRIGWQASCPMPNVNFPQRVKNSPP